MVHEHHGGKFMVNLVVEIARDEPAGIEDGDRRLGHSSRPSQLSDERKDQMGRRVQTVDRAMVRCVVQVRLDCDLLASPVSSVAASMSAIEIFKDGTPCLRIAFLVCKTAGERETMRSITAWLLLVSVHQEPVPFQVTAAGSCAQVTRPGTTPRGIPSGESVDANSEEGNVVAAPRDRVNCRRVKSILSYSSE
jgi:hypothetical protein